MPPALFLLLALNLALRLPLIDWHPGVLSDTLEILTREPLGGGKRLPLYPALARAVNFALFPPGPGDPLAAGRLAAMLAGAATVLPVWALARRLRGARAALIAAALYTASALPLRWSLRAMTESTFTLCFTAAAAAILAFAERRTPARLGAVLLSCGLALLARPEAVLLVPAMLACVALAPRALPRAAWGLVPFAALVAWQLALSGRVAYAGVLSSSLARLSAARFATTFAGYVALLAHALTPPVAACAVAGVALARPHRVWLALLLWLVLGSLAGASVGPAFSARHIVHVVPLCAVAAALALNRLLELRRAAAVALLTLCLAGSAAFSVAALRGARDTFADLARVAEAAGRLRPGRAILTPDIWFKTAWHAGARVRRYHRARVEPGALIALQSFYLPIEPELGWLREHFVIEVLAHEHATVRPLLGDNLFARGVRRTHHGVKWPWELFAEQRFESVLVEVKGIR